MSEFRSVLADGPAIGYLRDRLGVPDGRIVVRAVYDDQVKGRNDEKIVRSSAPRGINARKRHLGKKADLALAKLVAVKATFIFHSMNVVMLKYWRSAPS
jgi:hypothetical protein